MEEAVGSTLEETKGREYRTIYQHIYYYTTKEPHSNVFILTVCETSYSCYSGDGDMGRIPIHTGDRVR